MKLCTFVKLLKTDLIAQNDTKHTSIPMTYNFSVKTSKMLQHFRNVEFFRLKIPLVPLESTQASFFFGLQCLSLKALRTYIVRSDRHRNYTKVREALNFNLAKVSSNSLLKFMTKLFSENNQKSTAD